MFSDTIRAIKIVLFGELPNTVPSPLETLGFAIALTLPLALFMFMVDSNHKK